MGPARLGRYQFSPDSLVGLRKTLGITQGQTADLLGVPPNTLPRCSWRSLTKHVCRCCATGMTPGVGIMAGSDLVQSISASVS